MRLTDEQKERVIEIERNLYKVMPGAEMPGRIDLGEGITVPAWGDVEHTPHYEFCHLIAHLIVANSNPTN